MKRFARLCWIGIALALVTACDRATPPLLGSLEWDRISVLAEVSEPVTQWHVAEGDRVRAGTLLLELDQRRMQARVAQARAELARQQAILSERSNGARPEAIDAARGRLASARASMRDAQLALERIGGLRQRKLVSVADLDRATAARDQARANVRTAEANLRELTRGTRIEQIEQAAAAVDAAETQLQALRLSEARLQVRAPRDGVVDALPFQPGDQVRLGASLADLLVGDAPYARVFVPASQRAGIAPGQAMQVAIEGVQQPFAATVRQISSEPSFTPYFALTGDDASRMVYRAELQLSGERLDQLPAGLPVRAWIASDGG